MALPPRRRPGSTTTNGSTRRTLRVFAPTQRVSVACAGIRLPLRAEAPNASISGVVSISGTMPRNTAVCAAESSARRRGAFWQQHDDSGRRHEGCGRLAREGARAVGVPPSQLRELGAAGRPLPNAMAKTPAQHVRHALHRRPQLPRLRSRPRFARARRRLCRSRAAHGPAVAGAALPPCLLPRPLAETLYRSTGAVR